MYSAYKLKKQSDNIQPWHNPFPIWNQSVVPRLVLTVASWSAYRFLRRQVILSGIPISLRIFHSLLWSTQSLWHSQCRSRWSLLGLLSKIKCSRSGCFFWSVFAFFDDPMDVGNLISGSSPFSKSSLNIWKFIVHVLLKAGLENFELYLTSIWDECNCAVVWAFFGIAFPWDWNENWPFPVLWPLLSFPNLLTYWAQCFHSIIFQGLK